MSIPLLEVKNLSHCFIQPQGLFGLPHKIQAVNNVSLKLERKKTLGLVGESGCGKSTLARIIVRLQQPDSGDVLFDGVSVLNGPSSFRSSLPKRLQMVFQDPYSSFNPRLKIGNSIAETLSTLKLSRSEQESRVNELLLQVGLDPAYVNKYPHEFSGGQRQRLALARALAPKPELVICDEPVSSLDASVQAQVLNLMKDIQDELGLSYLFISHDLAVISHMSDEIAVMYLGQIIESGPAELLLERPLHPYTIQLLAASAHKEAAEHTKNSMQSSIYATNKGCRFAPHCPKVIPECLAQPLELTKLSHNQYVRCLLASQN